MEPYYHEDVETAEACLFRPMTQEQDQQLDRILSDIQHAFDDIFAKLPTEVVVQVAEHPDKMLQFVVESWCDRHPHGNPAHAEIFKYIMTLWFEDEAAKRKALVQDEKENDDSIHGEDSTK